METGAVVLVEGPSDAAVLDVLARRLGLDGRGVAVVPMGGVTNVGRYLRAYAEQPATRVAGLCDRGEVRFVTGALRRLGHDVVHAAEDGAGLAAYGFFVCDEDLEDELIRALGTDTVIEVIDREGELGRLRPSSSSRRSATGRCTTSCTGSPGRSPGARSAWPPRSPSSSPWTRCPPRCWTC